MLKILFTVFLLLPLLSQAQVSFIYYTDYREMGSPFPTFEGLPPEKCTFDPHYNASGQIEYYSFADMMRLNYSYNDKGQVEKKTLFLRFDADMIWQKFQETSYTYSGGKPVQERVADWKDEMYNDAGIVEPALYSLTEYIPDVTGKTDTVKSTEKRQNDKTYNLLAVRYLNSKGLPDSVITFNEENLLVPSFKFVQEYDKKNRCIRKKVYSRHPGWVSEKFLQEDTDSLLAEFEEQSAKVDEHSFYWWHAYSIEALYNSDKTTYTCITPKGEVTYQLTLNNDKQGRLIGQTLIHKGDIYSKAEFSYDNQGRTLVNKEVLQGELSRIGRLDAFRYDLEYNDNGQKKVTYYKYEEDENMFRKYQEFLSRSTSSGLITFFEKTEFYDEGDIAIRSKGSNTYNEAGLLTQQIKSQINSEGRWYERSKYVYEYNNKGVLISDEYYLKEDNNSPWKLIRKHKLK